MNKLDRDFISYWMFMVIGAACLLGELYLISIVSFICALWTNVELQDT